MAYFPGMALTLGMSVLHLTYQSCNIRFQVFNNFLDSFTKADLSGRLRMSQSNRPLQHLVKKVEGTDNSVLDQIFYLHFQTCELVKLTNTFMGRCSTPLLLPIFFVPRSLGYRHIYLLGLYAAAALSCVYTYSMDLMYLAKERTPLPKNNFACDFWAITNMILAYDLMNKSTDLIKRAEYTLTALHKVVNVYPSLAKVVSKLQVDLKFNSTKIHLL